MKALGAFVVLAAIFIPLGYSVTHDYFERTLGKEDGRRKAWQTGLWLGLLIGAGGAAMTVL